MKPNEMTVFIGDQEATARFDYEPEERQSWNGLTGVGHPGSPAAVCINEVSIGGSEWISAEHFSPAWLERTEEFILEAITARANEEQVCALEEMAEARAEEAAMAQWERQQERNEERGYP